MLLDFLYVKFAYGFLKLTSVKQVYLVLSLSWNVQSACENARICLVDLIGLSLI